jgi:hypothetical protein
VPAPSALASPFPDHVLITRREYELLQLKDRAMDVVQEGITIADASLPDMPLIYANEGFARVRCGAARARVAGGAASRAAHRAGAK